jgi:hypothetical protein
MQPEASPGGTTEPRAPACGSHHGAAAPRGLEVPAGATARGRFGRMFAFLPVRDVGLAGIDALTHVTDTYRAPSQSRSVPAGYTYLGQFVDHDITFDPTSVLDKVNDPLALVNFRTPRLDLDSLYGAGPVDQPFLYESKDPVYRGVKLLIGDNPPLDANGNALATHDLPRNAQGRALLGDARNDENLIVAQLHLVFIRFHNAVADHVRCHDGLEGPELFAEAQRLVRWHYQWVVVHDFLRQVAGTDMLACVLRPPGSWPRVQRRFYSWTGEPFIPVEFSAAAYRFGHSMVRLSYTPRDDHDNPPIFGPGDHHFGGFRTLPANLEIRWERFFALPDCAEPQRSRSIDPEISHHLFQLPADVAREPKLPRLNMRRAQALGLPAGPDVARAMGREPLDAAALLLNLVPAGTPQELVETLERAAPLWYYILCEALSEAEGQHLGHVGGRIVAEVLLGLIEGDPHSWLSQAPAWQPDFRDPATGCFGMPELLTFAGYDPSVGLDGDPWK